MLSHFARVVVLICVQDCPSRVTFEKEALAKCHHPFIISMDYAFQTPELAIMVTALGTGESLQFPEPIPEEHAIFYAAEIVLALNHIHSMGMIYRDLKPANVLLNADGHIQLVDMGGVVDVRGKTLGRSGNLLSLSGDIPEAEGALLFAPATMHIVNPESVYASHNNANPGLTPGLSENVSGRTPESGGALDHLSITSSYKDKFAERALSIMGTSGFMAPEMLALLRRRPEGPQGYTYAVDYWSLGVLIYVLVVGEMPFHHNDVVDFIDYINDPCEAPDYCRFRKHLDGLTIPSRLFKRIVVDLLTVDEKKRLGSGDGGIQNVKSHPWFSQNRFGSMPWSLLGKKLVRPLGKSKAGPVVPDEWDQPLYNSFREMLAGINASALTRVAPSSEQQALFDTWWVLRSLECAAQVLLYFLCCVCFCVCFCRDYVAPHVLKVELGAEEEEKKKALTLDQMANDNEDISLGSNQSYGGIETSINSIIGSMLSPTRSSFSSIGSPKKPCSVFPVDSNDSFGSFGTTKNGVAIANISARIKHLNDDIGDEQ
jgi:serine/threonine protein kinase